MGCFSTIFVMALFFFMMVTLIRWFEQITQAVDNGWWNHVVTLVFMPFMVWVYPSRVAAGRPTPVPHHEPVRGFGTGPSRTSAATSVAPIHDIPVATEAPSTPVAPVDVPPPGTPKEFLAVPQKTVAKPRAAVDPDKLAKLKQKMREQGMLPPEQ